MLPEAEQEVKTKLVLEAIAKAEDIEATDEEIDEQVKKMAEYYRQEPEDLRRALEIQGQLHFLIAGLIKEKTLQFLVEHAKLIHS